MLTVEDVRKIREDFPMLKSNPDLIYFDNGATTFKPQCVADAVNKFYTQETCNVHRGDYPLSAKVDGMRLAPPMPAARSNATP